MCNTIQCIWKYEYEYIPIDAHVQLIDINMSESFLRICLV